VGMSAAIACAVIDALGGQVEIPLTPEKLLEVAPTPTPPPSLAEGRRARR